VNGDDPEFKSTVPFPPATIRLTTHEHQWHFGTMAVQNVQNKLTQQVMQVPSIIQTCPCGSILHTLLPEVTAPREP